jgi:hypothetical protein
MLDCYCGGGTVSGAAKAAGWKVRRLPASALLPGKAQQSRAGGGRRWQQASQQRACCVLLRPSTCLPFLLLWSSTFLFSH